MSYHRRRRKVRNRFNNRWRLKSRSSLWKNSVAQPWKNGHDLSPFGNDATLTNGASVVADGELRRNAYSLTAALSQYLACDDADSLDITGPFTLSAWVNSSTANTTSAGIINKGNTDTGNGYNLVRMWGSATRAACYVRIGGAWKAITTTSTVFDGTWHHLLVVYTGTQLEIYVDCKADATPVAASGAVGTSNDPLVIGRGRSAATGYSYFDGLIADPCVFAAALGTGHREQLCSLGPDLKNSIVGPLLSVPVSSSTPSGGPFPYYTTGLMSGGFQTC